MNRDDLKLKLDAAAVLTELPDSKSAELVQDLLRHDGLPLLYGLLLGSRQALYAVLSESPLSNMETVSRAARIQGQIMGVALFYETLLEQAVPSQTDETKEQK